MKNIVKEKKGITLIALVITTIVLLIIAGISIGQLTGNNSSLTQSKDKTASSDLVKIQQAVIETYLKYKQLGNEIVLKGTKITYTEAHNYFNTLGSDEDLKLEEPYAQISGTDPGLVYYKLEPNNLKELGLEHIHKNDDYIVNYSTGEVFNISQKTISNGDALYIYAK